MRNRCGPRSADDRRILLHVPAWLYARVAEEARKDDASVSYSIQHLLIQGLGAAKRARARLSMERD